MTLSRILNKIQRNATQLWTADRNELTDVFRGFYAESRPNSGSGGDAAPVGHVHAPREQQVRQPQATLISTFFTLPSRRSCSALGNRRRQAGSSGDELRRHQLHREVEAPDRHQQARKQRHVAQSGDEGDRVEAGDQRRRPASSSCAGCRARRHSSRKRRHRAEIFERAERHVEQHADEQRDHDPACSVQRMEPRLRT